MTNMIQTQIMHNHSIPVTIQQLTRHMPRHIIIDLGKVLRRIHQHYIPTTYAHVQETDRNKETARAVRALEEVWEQLQPRIIAVHDQFSRPVSVPLGFDLREPRVLCGECGCCV